MKAEILWANPPARPQPATETVHLWWAALDQPDFVQKSLFQVLASDEQTRAARFHFERDRRHYVAGRGILRYILAAYLDEDPAALVFSYDGHNKPSLTHGGDRPALKFNLAHSHGRALYAVTGRRQIGIDLEQVRFLPDARQIAQQFFSPLENAMLSTLPDEQRLTGFFNCWTRKEAYVKALGTGITYPLDRFDVTLAPGQPAQLLHVSGAPEEVDRWSLHAFIPASGFVAALATEGTPGGYHFWRWIPPTPEAPK